MWTQTKEVETQPKKQKTQLVLEQVQVQKSPAVDPQQMPQEVPREEQSVPPVQLSPPKQVLMQIPPVQQVEPPPQADIEIHEIHSDLEEESGPSTFPVNILTSMTSSIPNTHLFENIFYSSFSQISFF